MTSPHPGVYKAASFICGSGGCITTFTQRPSRVIAGNLLDDVTYWWDALDGADEVPPYVVKALRELREATATWCDWLDRKEAEINARKQRPR